jgi:DNA-binding transcriptional regulator YiaG
MKPTREKEAARLKEMRQALGLTQSQLAEALRVTRRAVQMWEADDRKIPGPVFVALEFMIRHSG